MKVGLTATARSPTGLSRPRARSARAAASPASSRMRRKSGSLVSALLALEAPHLPAAAQRVLPLVEPTQAAGEEVLADPADLFRERLCGLAGDEPVVVVERRGEEGEDPLVALLVVDARGGSRRPGAAGSRALRFCQIDDPRPAAPGGLLGVDVEEAEVAEGAVAEVRLDLARHLAEQRAESSHQMGEAAGERRLAGAGVLEQRARPAADAAGRLVEEGPGPQPRGRRAGGWRRGCRSRASPRPSRSRRGRDGSARAPRCRAAWRPAGRDHRLAVADRDQLLALQGQEERRTISAAAGRHAAPRGGRAPARTLRRSRSSA